MKEMLSSHGFPALAQTIPSALQPLCMPRKLPPSLAPKNTYRTLWAMIYFLVWLPHWTERQYIVVVRSKGFTIRQKWIQLCALLLTSCETLGKVLGLFAHL